MLATAVALRSASSRPDIITTARLLRSAPLLLIATDCDEAGRAAWAWWKKNFPATNSFRWPVAVGKDVGDMVGAGGLSVKEWLKAGISEFVKSKSGLGW